MGPIQTANTISHLVPSNVNEESSAIARQSVTICVMLKAERFHDTDESLGSDVKLNSSFINYDVR